MIENRFNKGAIMAKLIKWTMVLLISGYASLGFADQAHEDAAQLIMTEMNSNNARAISNAIRNAGEYQYVEVFEAVQRAYHREMSRTFEGRNKPNTFVIAAVFQTLADLAARDNRTAIESIERDFNARYDAYVDRLEDPANIQPVNQALGELRAGYRNTTIDTLMTMVSPVTPRGAIQSATDAVRPPGRPANPIDNLTANVQATAAATAAEEPLDGSLESLLRSIPKDRNLGYSPGEIVLAGTSTLIRDKRAKSRADGNFVPVVGRDAESNQVLEALSRIKGMNVALLGTAGAGKTSIAHHIDDMSAEGAIPKTVANEPLQGLYVIETTPAKIGTLARSNDDNAQAAALELYIENVLRAQEILGVPLIVYIDEAHQISSAQAEALKRYMDDSAGVKIMFSSTASEYKNTFKQNRAFNRRVKEIPVMELSKDIIFNVLFEHWIPKLETRYGVVITEPIFRRIVEDAGKLLPDNGTLDGSIKLSQDLAIRHSISVDETEKYTVDRQNLSDFLADYYALPVDPNDVIAFTRFLENAKEQLNAIVIGQERMVNDIVDLFGQLIRNKNKNTSVAAIVGGTGVGKTLLGANLVKVLFDNPNAFFEINGNEFTSSHRVDSLLGAPNGFVSSDKTAGTFIEWLDDPSRGGRGGVVLMNELGKMDAKGVQRFMEAWDRGVLTGGDGMTRSLKNIIFITTDNRNATMLFPPAWSTWTRSELVNYLNSLTSDELKDKAKYNTTGGDDENKLADEIMNRVDLFTAASPITKDIALEIAEKTLKDKGAEYLADFNVRLVVEDPAVLSRIMQYSYNPIYGARPVVRAVDKYLQKIVFTYLGDESRAVDIDGDPVDINVTLVGDEFVLNDGVATVTAPTAQVTDPMSDPDFVRDILAFETEMNDLVFGQPEMITRITEAIIGHLGDPDGNEKALSIMLIGSTGIGKSETARAIATLRFKSRDRAAFINLGKVRFEGDFNRIFNPPPGYQGSNKMGEFETALISNPEGGVVLFDESSNMGGGNAAEKEAAFKQLYEITDEKTWTSSATGRTYDLTKYIFLFTGNDGDKVFAGHGSDDMRTAIWKSNKDKSKVFKILRDAGVPEPFLGRLADAILLKPLTRDVVERIAGKFLNPILAAANQWPGVTMTLPEDFSSVFARTFFTQNQGGRSVKAAAQTNLRSFLTRLRGIISVNGWANTRVEIAIQDNHPGTIFVEDAASFKREVKIVARIYDAFGVLLDTKEVDMTEHADKVTLFTIEQATLTSFHEIGHVRGNNPEHTGLNFEFVSLVPRDGYLGYARYTPSNTPKAFTLESLVSNVAMTLSGSAAQQLAGFSVDSGMSQDLADARRIISNAVLNSGLFPEFNASVGMTIKPGAAIPGRIAERVEQVTQMVFVDAWNVAVDRLVKDWAIVSHAAQVLLEEGEMPIERYNEVIAEDPGNVPPLDPATVERVRGYIGSSYESVRAQVCTNISNFGESTED